jgi:predicted solute-binding protein
MLAVADAALLIGDKGMLANSEGLLALDLGEGWRKLTGLPFVYAVWMGPPEKMTPELVSALQRSRDWGVTQTDEIVEEEAKRLGCSPRLVRHYLTHVMDYDLGEEHLQALQLFGDKARQENLLPGAAAPVRIAGMS